MPNAAVAARFNVSCSGKYSAPSPSHLTYPSSGGSGQKIYAVTGSGAGNVTKIINRQVAITASSDYTIDFAGYTDDLGTASITGSNIKAMWIQHDTTSAATSTIEITGASTNAIPALKTPQLLKGQECVPVYDPNGAGMTLTAPNKKLVIHNNDSANTATVNLWIGGE